MIAAAGSSWAQYDRDGRYVPSPMGVPADPDARPIPLYPGTPGGAIGTPSLPRLAPPPPPAAMTPRLTEPSTRSGSSLPVPFKVEQCSKDWSASMGMSRIEFKRRCHALRRL